MSKDPTIAPPALLTNLKHNRVLHREILLVSVHVDDIPRVSKLRRARQTRLASGIHRVELHYGFTERADVPAGLALADIPGFRFDPDDTTYFLGRESVVATNLPGMHPLRERLFVQLSRSASSAARFFALPADRVFEVGTTVDI